MTTAEELRALIQAHHLDEPRYRWRMRLAELAGVKVRTVHSWLDAGRQPGAQTMALLRERLANRP